MHPYVHFSFIDNSQEGRYGAHAHSHTHTHTHTHTPMKYYSAIKKNKILPFVTTWMDLKHSMLGEMSNGKRQILYYFTHRWNIKTKK